MQFIRWHLKDYDQKSSTTESILLLNSWDCCALETGDSWIFVLVSRASLKLISVFFFFGFGENRNNLNFLNFFTNKPYFFKLNLNCSCSQLSFEVHYTLETQNFQNFSIITSTKICRPLATKLRNLKLFKMFFQVDFSAKNVQRFSFELLVAPKLKKRLTTSFQSLGKIGLTITVITLTCNWLMSYPFAIILS